MLSSVYTKTHIDRTGRIWAHERAILICDNCGCQYERVINKEFWNRTTHFCNRKCFNDGIKVGGAADLARKQTCLERYGVEHPMLDPESDYRKRRNKTCEKRYKTTVPTKSDVVKRKTRSTCLKRYGVPYPMMNDDIKQRMVKSLKQNDLQAIAIKRIETMKRNKSFRKSRAEDKMYEFLIKRFNVNDVERNKRLDKTAWPIDFYVKSKDTWIQVDGVYWHGLDGQLEIHRNQSTINERSRIIVYKWKIDRKQERWFIENNLRLLRITDKQIESFTELPEDLASIAYFSC